jgi:ubiquinone/menaquinone biosynthesis C-methylase UbiE
MVDVGGGTGQLARRIARAHPGASVILFDQAHVLAMAPAAAGVEHVPGNFLECVAGGGDAYVLKFVLHDWDDGRAIRILRNCQEAMRASGRVFVIETVVPGDTESCMAKRHDLNMLVLTGGRERTLDEHQSLLSSAGLALVRTSRTDEGVDVLEAQRA